MGLLDKFKWWLDSVRALTSLLNKWHPRKCKAEKDYENSLYSFLNKELEGHQITKQYALGRFRADLVIDNKLIIEIKYNLDTPAKYRNLLGQLAEYIGWDGRIILLLVGKTDPDLKERLNSYLKKEGLCDTLSYERDKVTVYEK